MKTLEDIKRDGWESGINQVWNVDCSEAMKLIPDKSIDMILTDPPYKIQFVGKGSLAKKFDYRKNDINGIGSNINFDLIPFLNIMKPKLKKMNMYVWMAKQSIPEVIDWIRKNNFFWDLLIWGKNNPLPAYNFKYLSDIEYCFFIKESGMHWTKGLRYEMYKKVMIDNLQSIKGHPTPKPLWMMKKSIMVSSKQNDIILDPFFGSGTTGMACKILNRRFIGMEIIPKYCQLAETRLKNTIQEMFI